MKLLFILLFSVSLFGSRIYPESHYRDIFCKDMFGKIEVVLKDKTRVDCLTDEYAIEVDFADKWAEAVGQSLHYGIVTNRKPAIYLIIENESEYKYLYRLSDICLKYDIRIFFNDK